MTASNQASYPRSFLPSSSSKAMIRSFERPSTAPTRFSRPSTGSSGKSSNYHRGDRRIAQATSPNWDLTAHVNTTLAALDSRRHEELQERAPLYDMSKLTRPRPNAHKAQTASQDRGRPLAPVSSWNNLRFRRKASQESLTDGVNETAADATVTGSTAPSSLRRFPSLGFLRRKRSTSSSDLAHSGDSAHGHSNVELSTGSQNPQSALQPQEQSSRPSQQQQTSHTHSTSASYVFPSLPSTSTFELTITTGSAPINNSSSSFARPPKLNTVPRTSVSLYETSDRVKGLPTDPRPQRSRLTKRSIPIPANKTTVVARTPCTYDVTSRRPTRPRSSSLPLQPPPEKTDIDSTTNQSTSQIDADPHARSARLPDTQVEQAAKAQKVPDSHSTRPLNISTSLTDLSSTPMAQRSFGKQSAPSPRAANRYAAVYRPSPSLTNGSAEETNAKPSLSLPMPTDISVIHSVPPLSSTLPSLVSAVPKAIAARSNRQRNDSQSSPRIHAMSPSLSSSPMASPRPPPRAPIPESPGASPEMQSQPLPIITGSFSAAPSPIVASPLQNSSSAAPWNRPRAQTNAKPSLMHPNGYRIERKGSVPALGHFTGSNILTSSPKSAKAKVEAFQDTGAEKAGRSPGLGNSSNIRTVYLNNPTIPISDKRRSTLPITPTASEFSTYGSEIDDVLWGYFEKSGLAPSSKQQDRELRRSRSSNTLNQPSSHSSNNSVSSSHETHLTTPPLHTAPRPRRISGGVGVNMRKSVHTVYATSPSAISPHTPQTPSTGSLQTPPLSSDTSPSSASHQQRRPPPLTIVHRSETNPPPSIKLSSKQTIILREPPITRSLRAQRPTHLISHSLPSPKANSSFKMVDTSTRDEYVFLGANLPKDAHSPAFSSSPYPSPGLTLPVTPMTPMTPWVRSGRHAGSDSPILPPSP